MSCHAHSTTKSVGQIKATTVVPSIMKPSISFSDPKFQMIAVSHIRHLFATISHLKAIRIVYIVFLVEINLIIQIIQDHQLLPSLKLNFLLKLPFNIKKGITIYVRRPQGFLIILADGSTRVHVHKSEVFLPRYYTTMQST